MLRRRKICTGREREGCKKEALVETRSPQAVLPFLPPPLLLMSGLRRQRNRRSVRCQRTSCGCFQRTLLARDLQPPQLAPAARWDSSFPILLCILLTFVSYSLLLVVQSCSEHDLLGQDGLLLLLLPRHVHRLHLRPALPPVDRGAVQCSGAKPG